MISIHKEYVNSQNWFFVLLFDRYHDDKSYHKFFFLKAKISTLCFFFKEKVIWVNKDTLLLLLRVSELLYGNNFISVYHDSHSFHCFLVELYKFPT